MRPAPAWRAHAVGGGLAALALAPVHARADEPLFGYVNTTDLLPKGKWQVEQQLTARTDQAGGRYRRVEGRSEAEYGLRDNLQATLYLNYDYVDADRNSPRGVTEGLGVRPGHDPTRPYGRGRFDGASVELVWRVLSPYLAPVGLAVLGEASAGPDFSGTRVRAIAQKNFRNDTVVLAANLTGEWERRPAATPAPALRPSVSALELDLGASYRFRPNWSVGLEYRHRAEYAGGSLAGRSQHAADFAGPTLHYGGQRWFATLTALRQLHARVGDPALRAGSADGLVFAGRHTRWDGIRLRIGRTF